MAIFASACFGLLFLWHLPVHNLHHAAHGSELALHFKGMFFSFGLVSILAAYFLNKIIKERQLAEKEIADLIANQQRLASMTAVTSDAAHSLGTPLASINLIASELLRKSQEIGTDRELEEDLQTLKSEVKRCKNIIAELRTASGDLSLASFESTRLEELIQNICKQFNYTKIAIKIINRAEESYYLPIGPISKALKGLIINALEAQDANQSSCEIEIEIRQQNQFLDFIIKDSGTGFNQDISNNMRKAFFTTKNNPQNLGLGVYIADLVAQNLGGGLFYETNLNSNDKHKTIARFRVAVNYKQKYANT
jgi:two-component system sensor histidine kinase RegB